MSCPTGSGQLRAPRNATGSCADTRRGFEVSVCTTQVAGSPEQAVEAFTLSLPDGQELDYAVRPIGAEEEPVEVQRWTMPDLMPERLTEDGEVDERTVYAGEVFYVPFIAKYGRVGYRVCDHHGREEYIYLNPSGGEADRNVFVYHGEENDPAVDGAVHHYEVAEWPRGSER